jgi:crotonobetainyl-CoA:carnitine CoA-transferase CaiB-like acyl-CoA transferase
VLTVANEDEWSALCQLIDKDAWLSEPGLGSVKGRVVRHGEIDAAIEAWTSIRSPDDAAGALQAVGVRAGAVMNIGEIIDHDPQIAHRGFYHRFGDNEAVEGVPFQLTDAIQALDPRVHELGEDTSAVLSEVVGLGNEAIARLFKNGAVGGA